MPTARCSEPSAFARCRRSYSSIRPDEWCARSGRTSTISRVSCERGTIAKRAMAKAKATKSKKPPGPEPINEQLDALLLEDPSSDTTAYGDWLAERGHPRGELIALQNRDLHAEAARCLRRHPELAPFTETRRRELRW